MGGIRALLALEVDLGITVGFGVARHRVGLGCGLGRRRLKRGIWGGWIARPAHLQPRRYRAEGESCSQTAVEAGLFQRPVRILVASKTLLNSNQHSLTRHDAGMCSVARSELLTDRPHYHFYLSLADSDVAPNLLVDKAIRSQAQHQQLAIRQWVG